MFASNDYAQSQQSQQSQSSYQESYYPSQQTQPAPEEKEKEHGLFEVGDEEESGTEDTDRPLF
jgi:hypothetical protein